MKLYYSKSCNDPIRWYQGRMNQFFRATFWRKVKGKRKALTLLFDLLRV